MKNNRDPIIEEIHQTRRDIFDKFDGDITEMLDDARQRQAASGRPIWRGKANKTGATPVDQVEQIDE